MRAYQVVEGRSWHVRRLLNGVEPAERARWAGREMDVCGMLRRAVGEALHCRTAMLDGKVVAMWGVSGSLLERRGWVWLVLTPEARALPGAVVRVARQELRALTVLKPELYSLVDGSDGRALRWLRFLGFEIGPANDDGLCRAELRVS